VTYIIIVIIKDINSKKQ